MTRCTWILALLAALCLGACGGSSSNVAAAGGATDAGSTAPTDQEAIQEILQGCSASSTDELLALFQIIAPFLDTTTPTVPPGFGISGFDLLAGTIDWTMDLEPDGSIDATGTAGFRTAADAPYVPLSFLTLFPPLGDVSNLPTVVAGLPDGTIVRTSFNLTRGITANGTADVVLDNPTGSDAVASASSGNVTVSQPDCTSRFTWADVAIPDLSSPTLTYPNTVMSMEVETAEDTVTGTITFDGTSAATIDSTLQSTGTVQQFLFDLETGALTPVP